MPSEDLLTIRYIPLSKAVLFDGNPKLHSIGDIAESIRRYGFKEAVRWEPKLNDGNGGIVAGNGRITALQFMHKQKAPLPRGIQQDQETGEWLVPVIFGVDAESEMQAQAYAIDTNNLVVTGGDTELWDILALYDRQALADIAASIEDGFVTLDSASVELIVGNNDDDQDPDEAIAWSFQVHFKTTRGEQKELVDLVGPYFMPRSRRKLMPEFFAAMLKSYAREGTPMVVVDG